MIRNIRNCIVSKRMLSISNLWGGLLRFNPNSSGSVCENVFVALFSIQPCRPVEFFELLIKPDNKFLVHRAVVRTTYKAMLEPGDIAKCLTSGPWQRAYRKRIGYVESIRMLSHWCRLEMGKGDRTSPLHISYITTSHKRSTTIRMQRGSANGLRTGGSAKRAPRHATLVTTAIVGKPSLGSALLHPIPHAPDSNKGPSGRVHR